MQKIITALIKARSQFPPIIKDGVNPHFKSKYATLDSVLDAVTMPLCDQELAIVQTVEIAEQQRVLVTTLWHSSGESLNSRYPLPLVEDPQKLGSGLTYARRYALCALLSITADEDNDGNYGKPDTKSKPKTGEQNREAILAISEKFGTDRMTIKTIIKGLGKEDSSQLNPDELKQVQLQLMLSWSVSQGVFEAPQHAANSLKKLQQENPNVSMLELAQLWMQKVEHKVADLAVAE